MSTATRQPITAENFTEAMRQAVAERGADWVYPAEDGEWMLDGSSCCYFLLDGSPACIIGTALHKLGYGPNDVSEGTDAFGILTRWKAPLDVASAAGLAQDAQDEGKPWGEALATYETEMGL